MTINKTKSNFFTIKFSEYFTLNWLTIHRLLLTCLVLAIKSHDDHYFDNRAFETASGVKVK